MPRQRRGAPARSVASRPTVAPTRQPVASPQPTRREASTSAHVPATSQANPAAQAGKSPGLFGQMASTAAYATDRLLYFILNITLLVSLCPLDADELMAIVALPWAPRLDMLLAASSAETKATVLLRAKRRIARSRACQAMWIEAINGVHQIVILLLSSLQLAWMSTGETCRYVNGISINLYATILPPTPGKPVYRFLIMINIENLSNHGQELLG